MPDLQLERLVRARVKGGRGSRNALSAQDAARDFNNGLTVNGPNLAAQAIAAGLVDEYHLFITPPPGTIGRFRRAPPLAPAKVRDGLDQIVTVGQKLDDGRPSRPAHDHAVSTDVTHQY